MMERLQAWEETLAAFAERVGTGETTGVGIVALLVTGTALLVFLGVRFAFRRLNRLVESLRGTRIPPIKFHNQELLSADDTTRMVHQVVSLVRFGAYLLLGYVYLNLLFQLFPATRGVSHRLFSYLVDAGWSIGVAVVDYLPNLIFLIILFVVCRYVVTFTGAFFYSVALGRFRIPNFDPEWAQPTLNLVRLLVIAFFAVLAFPYLPGSTSPAFQGMSIFVGVLVSLGSSGAVADVIAGTVLTYTRAFRVGDRVRIADAEGDVVEKTLFVTRVRTVKNVNVTIPNALVMGHPMINFSHEAASHGLVLHTTVTIGYDVPCEKVRDALLAAARATEGVLESPPAFVHQTALDDFYVHYELNVRTNDAAQMAAIYSELHRHVLEQCHAAGIEIASPHLAAVRDGNAVQMPDPYLPKDYRPAPFRILPLSRRRQE